MKIGYIRVYSWERNSICPENLAKELNVDSVFFDICRSNNSKRTNLELMMNSLNSGDIVVVNQISDFAKNTKDFLNLINQLNDKGVDFQSKNEKIDTATFTGKYLLTVFNSLFQLDKKYILHCQREGIEEKKAEGGYKGRTPIDVDWHKFEQEYKLWKSCQITATEAMKRLGLKPNTFYRRVKEYEEKAKLILLDSTNI